MVRDLARKRGLIRHAEALKQAALNGSSVEELEQKAAELAHQDREVSSEQQSQGDVTPPFPVASLPAPLRSFVEELSGALPAPVDLAALPALAVASAAIGATRVVELKAGWRESAALYTAVVARPGDLKSPALERVTEPVRAVQSAYSRQYEDAKRAYERELFEYKRAERAALRDDREPPPRPEFPTRKRTWTADTTVERLGGLLSENPRGILILRDELAALARSLNQYKAQRGADKQFYLSAWSSMPISVDRQKQEPLLVDRPFLSITGCVPPGVLSQLDEESGEDGWIYRFLFAYPEPVPVRWTDNEVSVASVSEFQTLIANLYKLEFYHETEPVVLPLTEHAQQVWRDWHDTHCIEADHPDLPPPLQGFYAKLKGYGARLALVHALCADPHATAVGVESIGAAADLIDYFKAHARKVTPLLIRKTRTKEERCEAEIRRALASGKALSKREIQRSGNADSQTFNAVFDAMLKADQLIEIRRPGGRGARVFYKLRE